MFWENFNVWQRGFFPRIFRITKSRKCSGPCCCLAHIFPLSSCYLSFDSIKTHSHMSQHPGGSWLHPDPRMGACGSAWADPTPWPYRLVQGWACDSGLACCGVVSKWVGGKLLVNILWPQEEPIIGWRWLEGRAQGWKETSWLHHWVTESMLPNSGVCKDRALRITLLELILVTCNSMHPNQCTGHPGNLAFKQTCNTLVLI